MKLNVFLTLSAIAFSSASAPAVNADTYTTRTITTEQAPIEPMVETREVRTIETTPTTVIREQPTVIREQSTVIREQPTVVREQPVIIQPKKETVIIKKHDHHLIKVGPIKVF